SGNSYCYRISALNNLDSNIISISNHACNTIYSIIPASIRIKRVSVTQSGISGTNIIEWKNPFATDTNVSGYHVYHSNLYTGTYSLIHNETDTSVRSFYQSPVN